MSEYKLLPCPFCGGDARTERPVMSDKQYHNLKEVFDKLCAYSRQQDDQIARLKDALNAFEIYGCPVCRGDCGAANPPVSLCPMKMAQDAKVFHQPK